MIREIANRFAGRKKIEDLSISFSNVIKLLSELDETIRINIEYSSYRDYVKFEPAKPANVAKFLNEEFQPNLIRYCNASHQVFDGIKDKRHYIDLKFGLITTKTGTRKKRKDNYKKATLDYIINKRAEGELKYKFY